MAIIYTYPNLPLSSLSAEDLLVITNVDATNNNPTRSVTLADIATYVTGTGSGTGTTNKIVKFTDGPNGLLGDSIMTESTGLIDLAGQFVSTSSPTLTQAGPVSGIKATLNGTTAAPNVALYGESINTGSTQADSNYGLYAKGEFEGTGGFTGFAIGGNLEGRYDGTGTNGPNATVYGSYNLARATTAANGTISYMIGANNLAKLEGANVTATNLQATHSTVELSNGTAGDVIVQILDFDTSGGGTVTGDLSYLRIQNDAMPTVAGTARAIDSKSVLPSLFTGQVEIPLVPTINAHATSKQYVDQQISSVVSGLVFQSTWDARTQAEGGLAGDAGNPDLSAADKKVVGHYYVVSTAGSATPNGAGTLPNSWNVGDWCIYVEQGATDRWEKLDQTFVSGAGAAGQVTYWNSQNEVAGDNNLFFDSTNKRLGIGTTSPVQNLDVSGNIASNSIYLFDSTSNDRLVLDLDVSDNLQISTGTSAGSRAITFITEGLERMRINSAGDIFISPRDTAASSGSGILYFKNVDDNSATINGGSIRTVDSTNNPSGADMRFQVANDAGTLFDAVAIDSNGFMGIGNMAPDYTLDISGSARINSSVSNAVQLVIDNSNTTDAGTETSEIRFTHYRSYVPGQNVAGNIIVGKEEPWNAANDRNSYMSFKTRTGAAGVTEKMRITSVGNVGIGTTSPDYKLHTKGTVNGNVNIAVENASTGVDAYSSYRLKNDSIDTAVVFLNGSNNTNYAGASSLNMYQGTSLPLGFVTNNLLRMIVAGDGNVGIGTDSPDRKLEVENTSGAGDVCITGTTGSRLYFRPTSSYTPGGNFGILVTGSGAPEYLSTMSITGYGSGINTLMTLKGDGNIGIGTTSPSSKLSIGGNAITTLKPTAVISDTINGASLTLRGQSPILFFDGTAAGVPKILMDGQGIEFKTGTLDTQGDVNFSLDSSGDVSIQNTTGSIFNLRRDDTSIVSGDDLGSIFFQGNDPSSPFKSGAAIIGEGDGTWNMGSPNVYPSRLLFQTAKQNTLITAMRISSDQNVGIGTTTNAGAKLEVANYAEGTYLIVGGDTASNSRALAFTSSTSGVTNGALHTINAQSGNGVIALATAGAERMRADNAGNVLFGTTATPDGTSAYGSGFIPVSTDKVALRMASSSTAQGTLIEFFNPNGTVGHITISGSATTYSTSSDYRLKKDLKDFDGLGKVSKIPVYDFKWKVDNSSSYGVMAHELQDILPDAVSGEKDGEEMQGVDYSKIVPLLIKSIQELEAKVKILENK
jgi:hypothetical protein|tara:strand:+ start:3039 stop:6827 length:3789 start_codon:yes stop_codon:yes gene_type:complete